MQRIAFNGCTIQTININYYEKGGKAMDIGIDEPFTGVVNIGDVADENSLARQLLDTIDKVRDRLFFLVSSFEALEETGTKFYLDGPISICKDMLNEATEAHEILCSPDLYIKKLASETPGADTPEAKE